MADFDQVLARAIERLDTELEARGLPGNERRRIVEQAGELNLLGLLSVLAASPALERALGERLIEELAGRIAEQEQATALGVDSEHAARAVTDLLFGRRSLDEVLTSDEARGLVRRALLEYAEQGGLAISEEELAEALELLRSGELREDLSSGVRVSLRTLLHMPSAVVVDLFQAPALPAQLVRGLAGDVLGRMGSLLRDGRLDRGDPVLDRTLGALYELETAASVAQWIRALTAPDNRSFRLALILYARSRGVDVDEETLDAARAAFDEDEPDLGPLLAHGIDRLGNQLEGGRSGESIAERLGALR